MAYAGEIAPLFIGTGGLAGTSNLALIAPNKLIEANGITLEEGTLKKEGGATKLNSTALSGAPSIVAGHDWWPTSSTQRTIIATSDGDLLRDTGSGTFATTLKSGLTLTASSVPVFSEGGQEDAGNSKKLFFYNGADPVQVLTADGVATTDLSSPTADWTGSNQPAFGLIHDSYHWAGGNANDPHRMYYSDIDDHENFSGNTSISVYPGEGDRLIGAISFKGVMICWKYPKGIYIIDTTDPTPSNWKVTKLTARIGLASPAAFAQLEDDVIFMGPAGNIHSLYATSEFGDLGTAALSNKDEMDTYIRNRVAIAQLQTARAVYYSNKRQVHFAVAGTGSTINNRRLIYDLNAQEARFMWSERDTPISMWLRGDSFGVDKLAHGDNAGFVWLMDKDTRSKDGTGYEGTARSADMDLSHLDPVLGSIEKQFDFLELIVEPLGNWNVSCDVYIDGSLKKTLQFNLGVTGAVLGSFVLGTDKLAGDSVTNRIKRVALYGTRIGFAFRNNGAGQDYSIAGVNLYFRRGKGNARA